MSLIVLDFIGCYKLVLVLEWYSSIKGGILVDSSTRMCVYSNTRVHVYSSTRVFEYSSTRLPVYSITRKTNTRPLEYSNICILE